MTFYTYGDTNEPDVTAQVQPLCADVAELFALVRDLERRLRDHEARDATQRERNIYAAHSAAAATSLPAGEQLP